MSSLKNPGNFAVVSLGQVTATWDQRLFPLVPPKVPTWREPSRDGRETCCFGVYTGTIHISSSHATSVSPFLGGSTRQTSELLLSMTFSLRWEWTTEPSAINSLMPPAAPENLRSSQRRWCRKASLGRIMMTVVSWVSWDFLVKSWKELLQYVLPHNGWGIETKLYT